MDVFLSLLSNIVIPGFLFALITVGFSVIYGVTRILHVAHGGVVLLAGYAFYFGTHELGWSWAAATVYAVALSVLVGVLANVLIYERMRKRGAVSTAGSLIATLSLLLLIQNACLAIFGAGTKTFTAYQGVVHVLGPVAITDHEVRMVVVSIILLSVVGFFLSATRFGKALRAVADNSMMAEIVGIPAKRIRHATFAIGSCLAGIAGVLFAIEYGLEPSMATMVGTRMFFRAIVGGVGSTFGAFLGSFSIETVTALVGWYATVAWVDLAGFVVAVLVLFVRPEGLVGKGKRAL